MLHSKPYQTFKNKMLHFDDDIEFSDILYSNIKASVLPQGAQLPPILLMPENKMTVLIDETYYPEFDDEIRKHSEIQTVIINSHSSNIVGQKARIIDKFHDLFAVKQVSRDFSSSVFLIRHLLRSENSLRNYYLSSG